MEEWKIGEIRQVNGEWYQCVKGNTCNDCAFYRSSCGSLNCKGSCRYNFREDATNVIFKKLEKVGKPYEHYEKFYQCYKLPMETEIRLLPNNCYPIGKDNLVEIEIKQKEDMEEKKIQLKQEDIDYLTRKIRYLVYKTNDYDRATEEIMNLFIPSDTEHSSSEKIGKNLKPFDLETAKAGKPVCTRDGRKARIICFDLKNEEYPIVAAIGNDSSETLLCYTINGEIVKGNYKSDKDLMMLPEKKEGYANIYRSQIYDTLERAKEAYKRTCNDDNYLQTIKIEWEE